jgi:hypothetical protein
MGEAANEVRRDKPNIQDLAFKIFAVVGFLSSIVTIISWINATHESLSATITQTSIETPTQLQISNLELTQYDAEAAFTDLNSKYCNPVAVDFAGSKSRNYHYSIDKCQASKKIFDSITKIISLDGKKLLAWDILLSNDGKDVAENITLRSPVAVSVRTKDGDGNVLDVKPSSGNKVFILPNLNPRESLDIRLISSTAQSEDFEHSLPKPKVTYSGGIASNRELIVISGRYSGIVEFLESIPTVFQVFFVVFVSFIITAVWTAPLGALMEAAEKRKESVDDSETT